MNYLDNAATTSPKPQPVIDAVEYAMKNLSANPGRAGHKLSMAAAEAVFDVRIKAADFFGCKSPEMVVFTSGCTTAVNTVLKGVLKKGDHVVTSSLEHNAVSRPLHSLKDKGIHFSEAVVVPGDDAATLKNFENAMKSSTRLVITTHASNVFGVVVPVADIGRLCRKKGVLFAVDSAQTAGVLPIDVTDMNIDFLCVAAHKGLYAPMGNGILISNTHEIRPLVEGGTGTQSLEQVQPDELPERLESGTINLPGIAGIGAGIDFIRSGGINNIYLHEMQLMHRLYVNLQQIPGVKLYTGTGVNQVPVLSFNINGADSFTVGAYLDERDIAVRPGLHCAPAAHKQFGTLPNGTVRACPSVFSTPEDIDRLSYAIAEYKQ